MTGKDKIWKRDDLSKRYLEGVRGAIPLADYQIEIILMLVKEFRDKPGNILDLGCGDGILGRAILAEYPKAKAVFLDISDTMIKAARKKFRRGAANASFITQDYGDPAWVSAAASRGKFDVIVSGLSIHHQADKRKKEIYKEIFGLLKPGGLFLNFEHVSSATPRLKRVWDEYFIDSIYKYHRASGSNKTRAQIAKKHFNNPLQEANILAPVEAQCAWLRKAGYKEVDCYLKIFELAIFGGIKPR